MTVAPRYAAYEDAVDTGLDAPLELPCCLHSRHAGTATAPASPDRAASSGSLHACSAAAPVPPAPASPGHELGEQPAPHLPGLPAGSRLGRDDRVRGGSEAVQPGGAGAAAAGGAGSLLRRSARLYLCRQAGVERVFVGHPLYEAAHDIYGPSGADTYLQGDEFSDLDLRYSVLCQAALAAPLLLWGRPAAQPGGAAEPGGPATMSQAPIAGTAADSGVAAAEHGCGEACEVDHLGAAGGKPPCRGAAEGAATAAAADASAAAPSLGRILFVGNDWPCAPLALRLQHCVRACQAGDCGDASCCRCGAETGAGPDAGPKLDLAAFRAALGAALRDAHSAFCIHNLAYQGGLPLAAFARLCLPRSARAALEWPQPSHGGTGDRGNPGSSPTGSRAARDDARDGPPDARARGLGSRDAGAAGGMPLASASAPAFACAEAAGLVPADAEDVRSGKRRRAASAQQVARSGVDAAGPGPGGAALGSAAGAWVPRGAPATRENCRVATADVEDAAESLNWMHVRALGSQRLSSPRDRWWRDQALARSQGQHCRCAWADVCSASRTSSLRSWVATCSAACCLLSACLRCSC